MAVLAVVWVVEQKDNIGLGELVGVFVFVFVFSYPVVVLSCGCVFVFIYPVLFVLWLFIFG